MTEEQTLSTARIEAFSDGVFAIVITLLVLELRVPHIEHGQDFGELAAATWKLMPKFFSFLLSFFFAAIFWTAHHQFFHQFRHSTRGLLWFNNLFLLSLIFLPFPTALLGEYPDNKFAVMFFGLEMIFVISTQKLLRWYGAFKAKLLKPEASEADVKKALIAGIYSVAAYIFAVIVCLLISPTAAIGIYFMVPLLYMLSQRRTEN